jgi:hypothetical protein
MGVLELTDVVEEEGEEISDEAQEQAEQSFEETTPDDLGVLLLTDLVEEEVEKTPTELEDLSEQEREVVKGRLKEVLKKFQERKQISPQEPDGVLLTDIIQELSKEALFDKTILSEQQQERVKNRLKGILETFQVEIQEGRLETGGQRVQKISPKTGRGVPLDEVGLSKETQETVEFRPGEFSERILRNETRFQPISTDEDLTAACEKISQGHSLAVFDSINLTDRERDLINAFIAHLSTYKGLKKQQAFEMQHLTARSIHELDLIFKTYHIQGYLKGELKNVYNRLLNLRGRFSILLN